MGLSIHYGGTLQNIAMLPELIEEVQDVCTILGWQCRSVNEDDISGVSFTPPECETVSLTFRPSGELINLGYLRYGIEPVNVKSVKTQYAGMDVHIVVIKLLRHLAARYFVSFDLNDEGGYWETDNEEVLRKKFGQYNSLLDAVQVELMNFETLPNDTPQALAERLEDFLGERLRDNREQDNFKANGNRTN